MAGSRQLDRRDFLKVAGAGTGALLLGGPLLAACGATGPQASKTAGAEKSPEASKTGDAVNIGAILHLSGGGSVWGPIQQQPAELAVEEINAAGGVLGRPLVLLSVDDQTNPDVAAREATKIVQEQGAVALFGTVYSTVRQAVEANVTDRYHTPFFEPTYNAGEHCGKYLINLGAQPNQQLDKLVPYMMEQFGPKFYFLGADYVWPQDSIAYCSKLVESLGGTVVGSEFVGIGTTSDWAPIVGRIRDAAPDAFFPFIGGDDLVSMLRQFGDFGLNKTIQIGATLLDESFIPALPEDLRAGILCSESYFMAVDNPANTAFLERFRAKFGQDGIVTNVGELMYDAIWMWWEAIEACGRVGQTDEDYDAMIDALYEITFDDAPQGPGVSLLAGTNHARVHSFVAESQADGTFKILKDYGLVDPVADCRPR